MYAHYFTTKGAHFLIISADMTPSGVKIPCSGKREARAIAKAHNATCWNF